MEACLYKFKREIIPKVFKPWGWSHVKEQQNLARGLHKPSFPRNNASEIFRKNTSLQYASLGTGKVYSTNTGYNYLTGIKGLHFQLEGNGIMSLVKNSQT